VALAPVLLDRDLFLRSLLRELAGTLEDASGFISVVGQNIGRQINEDYKLALGVKNLSRSQVASVLVDLKRRIQCDFFVIEESDEKIVPGNQRSSFAEKVIGRPSLCMMTSNVFGAANWRLAHLTGRSPAAFTDALLTDPTERVEQYLLLCVRSEEMVLGSLTMSRDGNAPVVVLRWGIFKRANSWGW
jgi:hypothetical protein